jgi:hypothetical protein
MDHQQPDQSQDEGGQVQRQHPKTKPKTTPLGFGSGSSTGRLPSTSQSRATPARMSSQGGASSSAHPSASGGQTGSGRPSTGGRPPRAPTGTSGVSQDAGNRSIAGTSGSATPSPSQYKDILKRIAKGTIDREEWEWKYFERTIIHDERLKQFQELKEEYEAQINRG